MDTTNLIDWQIFDDLLAATGSDPEFLSELMDTYFQDASQQLADIGTALAAGNAAEVRRAAHSLKSNSANFGARHLATLCKELEELGKAGVLEGAEAKLALMQAEYAQVRVALEQKRAEMTR